MDQVWCEGRGQGSGEVWLREIQEELKKGEWDGCVEVGMAFKSYM